MRNPASVLTTRAVSQAEAHLREVDEKMGALITRVGHCTIRPCNDDHFDTLASAIVSQQLSAKAAKAIKSKIEATLSCNRPFKPSHFDRLRASHLRLAGLSWAKSKYLVCLADSFHRGQFSVKLLKTLDNEAAITCLMELKGVGKWTAEMFLIFGLRRADICASSDAGLRRAARLLYQYESPLTEEQFEKLADRWRPYRSVASWYLWRLLD